MCFISRSRKTGEGEKASSKAFPVSNIGAQGGRKNWRALPGRAARLHFTGQSPGCQLLQINTSLRHHLLRCSNGEK